MSFRPFDISSSFTNLTKFERGTISYLITSTLTRPTTISPTITCDRRVILQDDFDVASLPIPKPRVITLEPISKRSRVKAKVKSGSLDRVQEVSPPLRLRPLRTSTDATSTTASSIDNHPPQSPASSEVSNASNATNSSQSFQVVNPNGSANGTNVRTNESRSSTNTSKSDNIITATTEVLKAGGLPGDTIPIRISINHTKCVRSMHGVIVTLYRQGRVDMHPAIPLGTGNKGKKPEYEDYYPKSKTGLGGLSLSAGKSSTLYRNDLAQSFAPLVVNPQTMTAFVKTSITIPDDAFPTIIHVPGSMITFRYYIEVVIDLRGKLANTNRSLLPQFNMTSYPNKYADGQPTNWRDDHGAQVTSSWAGNILDTDQIRREKSVVDCLFPITVGSRDSARSSRRAQTHDAQNPGEQYGMGYEQEWTEDQYTEEDYYNYYGYYPDYDSYPRQDTIHQPSAAPQPDLIPPPDLEEQVDEKTRLRREEALLLPSAPPQDENAGPSAAEALAPSAPYLPEEDNHYTYNGSYGIAQLSGTPHSIASAPSVDTIVPNLGSDEQQPDFTVLPDPAVPHPQDDKQELERQRLLQLAGAPPTDDDEGANGGPSAPDRGHAFAPTAPVLTEGDEYSHLITNSHDHADRGGESLPQYRR